MIILSARLLSLHHPNLSGLWSLEQQASEKASQLIEVVRPGDMHIFADRDFFALTDLFNAEDHHRHILCYSRTFTDTICGINNFTR
jgi:hypothetical protein